jgi:hypothetical protein
MRVKFDGVVPTDTTLPTSPLTLPSPEFAGEGDTAGAVRLKVGLMENP